MCSYRVWEADAAQLRAELGLEDTIIHPKILASRYELRVETRAARRSSCWDGSLILIDARATPEQQAFDLAHELGHFALDRYGSEQSERAASYVGGALLMPRRPFSAAVRSHGRNNLEALHRSFPFPSSEVIARRIVDVDEAVVTIAQGRRVVARVGSPWLAPPRERLARDEAAVIRRVLETGQRVDEGWISGTPAGPRRVILIAEFEQLSMRY